MPDDTPLMQSEAGRMVISSQVNEISEQFKENKDFFTEFCEIYKKDPDTAKALYYQKKFGIDCKQEPGQQKLNDLLYSYLEGLQWVLFYYFRGPAHWGWFYPYHYPPMVTDFNDIEAIIRSKTGATPSNDQEPLKIEFNWEDPDNMPLNPLLSLLCLMPVTSKELLPECLHGAYKSDSPLADLFPTEIEIDLNGRSLPWEAISLVPFVQADRVRKFFHEVMQAEGTQLSEMEKLRNEFHSEIYMRVDPKTKALHSLPSINSAFGYRDIPAEENRVRESYPEEVKDPMVVAFKPPKQTPLKAEILQKEQVV